MLGRKSDQTWITVHTPQTKPPHRCSFWLSARTLPRNPRRRGSPAREFQVQWHMVRKRRDVVVMMMRPLLRERTS